MIDGLLKMAGNFVPDEKKVEAVYNAIHKIMDYQAVKLKKDVAILRAIINKDSNNVLHLNIYAISDNGLDWLCKVDDKELIKILNT